MNEHIAAINDSHVKDAVWIRLHKDSALVDWIMNGSGGVVEKELRDELDALEEELSTLIL